jgi:hypothetical protein
MVIDVLVTAILAGYVVNDHGHAGFIAGRWAGGTRGAAPATFFPLERRSGLPAP